MTTTPPPLKGEEEELLRARGLRCARRGRPFVGRDVQAAGGMALTRHLDGAFGCLLLAGGVAGAQAEKGRGGEKSKNGFHGLYPMLARGCANINEPQTGRFRGRGCASRGSSG